MILHRTVRLPGSIEACPSNGGHAFGDSVSPDSARDDTRFADYTFAHTG